jgi:hypothetical protein
VRSSTEEEEVEEEEMLAKAWEEGAKMQMFM